MRLAGRSHRRIRANAPAFLAGYLVKIAHIAGAADKSDDNEIDNRISAENEGDSDDSRSSGGLASGGIIRLERDSQIHQAGINENQNRDRAA